MRWLSLLLVLALALPVAGCAGQVPPSLKVTHQVEGNTVVLDIEATGPNMWTETHPHLTVDDGLEVMIYSPRYVIKNLAPGEHKIRVYLSDGQHRELGIEEIIQVNIQ